MALHELGLCDAAARVRDGRITAAALMRACLARIHEREPAVRAWQHLDAGRAIARAEELDAAHAAGHPPGRLAGVPIGVKDIIDVAGMPTTMGSPIFAGNMPAATAQCVARLEAAGAIVVGKTVTTEFAYYSPGTTRNPWNIAHTPGGSSSGSAAAIAARMVMGAIGTQTNGSVIRPAAFCGVVGFKPGYGATSCHGTLDPWPTLDHTGVIARSVADAAQLAVVLVDPGTPLHGDVALPARPPNIVALRTHVWDAATAAQQAAFTRSMQELRAAGAVVEEVALPAAFAGAHAAMRVIMAAEAARHFGDLRARDGDRLSERLRALIDEGAALARSRYDEALALRRELQHTDFMAGADAAITPPASGEAPGTLEQTGDPVFCSLWSLIGVPAMTIPVALGPRGLPLGLQIVGRHGDDDGMLSAAAWCEARIAFDGRPLA